MSLQQWVGLLPVQYNEDNGFWSKEQAGSLPILRDSSRVNSGFSPGMRLAACTAVSWASPCCSVGTGAGELAPSWSSVYGTALRIKSLVSDPGVSCLPIVSMKLWQGYVLAYHEDEISDLSLFLAYGLPH